MLIILKFRTKFVVLSCRHDKVIVSVHVVYLMNVVQCQAAANPRTDLCCGLDL